MPLTFYTQMAALTLPPNLPASLEGIPVRSGRDFHRSDYECMHQIS